MNGRPIIATAGAAALLLAMFATLVATRRSDPPPERPSDHAPPPAAQDPVPENPDVTHPPSPEPGREKRELTVRVVAAEDGTPIAGARVDLIWRTDLRWNRSAETEKGGRARFTVPPGVFCVRAKAPGRNLKLVTTKADSAEVEVALHPTSVLHGLVTELGSGDPIEGVTARSGDHEAVTGPDGRFTLPGIQERSRSAVTLSGPWHVPEKVQMKEVRPGETIEMQFVLAAAGRVSGVVLDADGTPAAGAWVHTDWKLVARTYGPRMEPGEPVVSTDAEGRFALACLKTATGARVFAALDGATAGASLPFDLRAGEEATGLVVRLGRRRAVTVTVATEDGSAPAKIEAHLHCGKEDPWAPLPGLPRADIGREFEIPGEFTLEGLAGRPFTLYICAEGYRPHALSSTEALPVADLPLRRVRIVLARGLAVSGVLLDEEGRPVAGVVIHANRGRAHLRKRIPFSCLHTRTDSLGRFRVGGLDDFEYEVHATTRRGGSERVTGVRGGTEGVTLRLK